MFDEQLIKNVAFRKTNQIIFIKGRFRFNIAIITVLSPDRKFKELTDKIQHSSTLY